MKNRKMISAGKIKTKRRQRKAGAPKKGKNDRKKEQQDIWAHATEIKEKIPLRLSKEKVLEVILSHFIEKGYWKATKELAECMDIEFKKLSLSSSTEKKVAYVWCTVIVLSFCQSELLDYKEYWIKTAKKARSWLFLQPEFLSGKSDLILTTSEVLAVDSEAMTKTIFAKDFGEIQESEASASETKDDDELGDWEKLVMETPPYSIYYQHKVTYETTWEHPSVVLRKKAEAEAKAAAKLAKEEAEAAELKQLMIDQAEAARRGDEEVRKALMEKRMALVKKREALFAKGELLELKRSKDVSVYHIPQSALRPAYVPPPRVSCKGKFCAGKNAATICCMGCAAASEETNASWNWKRKSDIKNDGDNNVTMGLYLCESCCDEIHMQPEFSNHVNLGYFRFASCFGKFGLKTQKQMSDSNTPVP